MIRIGIKAIKNRPIRETSKENQPHSITRTNKRWFIIGLKLIPLTGFGCFNWNTYYFVIKLSLINNTINQCVKGVASFF